MLERSTCFGICPAYRLSITAAGHVSFLLLNPGDSARAASDTISRETFESFVAQAESIGFFTLPDTIANDNALCPLRATDHPTAAVTVYRGAGNKHVVDYHGCVAQPDRSTTPVITALRALEARVDSIAGSDRWVKPATRAP